MGVRRRGWYWVKFSSGGKWICLFYNGQVWDYRGEPIWDSGLDIIDSRIPTPDEAL